MLSKGDHLAVPFSTAGKVLYHHGIYIGDNRVIDSNAQGIHKKDILEFWDRETPLFRITFPGRELYPDEVVKEARALYKNQEKWGPYDLFINNCEHFAMWCKTRVKISFQIIKELRKSLGQHCKEAAESLTAKKKASSSGSSSK